MTQTTQYDLRPYQLAAVEDAADWFSTAARGDRRLYAAPTGTGKSIVELELQARCPDAVLMTPRVEIVAGMMNKLGVDTDALSVPRLMDAALQRRITTPLRLRNALARAEVEPPARLIVDEVHHFNATTYQEIRLMCGDVPTVGYTATPFRGTPAGTIEFRRQWGEPTWIITYPEAAALGHLSVPSCRVVPLLDDDLVSVSNGEFVVSSANEAASDRLSAVAELIASFDRPRPTMLAVPSVECARMAVDALGRAGIDAVAVTGETAAPDRQRAFNDVVACRRVLVQINVVSEGVDLPIRRLIDLRPTLSPVYWLQLVGRITRPTDDPPEYVCCCRNLERHAYLLAGCLPPSVVRDAQQAFDRPSSRLGSRAVGFEALGRFKATELPLADGSRGVMYCLQTVEGQHVRQYALLLHPASAEPIVATKTNVRSDDGQSTLYGRWTECSFPDGVEGFASVQAGEMSDKQKAWWQRAAKRHGLDPTADVNRRQFAALPVLSDLRARLSA